MSQMAQPSNKSDSICGSEAKNANLCADLIDVKQNLSAAVVVVCATAPSQQNSHIDNNNDCNFNSQADSESKYQSIKITTQVATSAVAINHQQKQQQQLVTGMAKNRDYKICEHFNESLNIDKTAAAATTLTKMKEHVQQSAAENLKQGQTIDLQQHKSRQQQQQSEQTQSQHASVAYSQVPSQTANNRSVLILREISPETPEDLVKNIFISENCPSEPVHCEYAHNNSWYVTFKNDEDARQALTFIRKYAIEWNNKLIMARIKPKPATISVNNDQNTNSLLASTMSNASITNMSSADLPDGPALVSSTNSTITGTSLINPVASTSAVSADGVVLHRHQTPGPIMPGHHIMPHHHHGSPAPSGSHHYSYAPMGYYGPPPTTMVPMWNAGNQPYLDLREYFKRNGLVPDQASFKQNQHNLVISTPPLPSSQQPQTHYHKIEKK